MLNIIQKKNSIVKIITGKGVKKLITFFKGNIIGIFSVSALLCWLFSCRNEVNKKWKDHSVSAGGDTVVVILTLPKKHPWTLPMVLQELIWEPNWTNMGSKVTAQEYTAIWKRKSGIVNIQITFIFILHLSPPGFCWIQSVPFSVIAAVYCTWQIKDYHQKRHVYALLLNSN